MHGNIKFNAVYSLESVKINALCEMFINVHFDKYCLVHTYRFSLFGFKRLQ